jgi:tRNA(fMet)-specific endonuclease VapC
VQAGVNKDGEEGRDRVNNDKDDEDDGEIKAQLKKNGRMIGPMDLLIGAQAKSKGWILVTRNVKEFKRIPDLGMENWAESGRGA